MSTLNTHHAGSQQHLNIHLNLNAGRAVMWEITCDFWASRSLDCSHSSLLQWACQESCQFGFKSLPVLFKIINPRHLFRTCPQILLAMVNPLNFAFTVHDVYKNSRWNYKLAIQSLVFFLLRCNNELDKNKVDPGISIQKLSLETWAVVCKPMFLCQYNNGISTPINKYRSTAEFMVEVTSQNELYLFLNYIINS